VLFSISISTTSPSTISDSSFILTPIDLLKAYVRASVLLISSEKISEPAILVKGVSSPKAYKNITPYDKNEILKRIKNEKLLWPFP